MSTDYFGDEWESTYIQAEDHETSRLGWLPLIALLLAALLYTANRAFEYYTRPPVLTFKMLPPQPNCEVIRPGDTVVLGNGTRNYIIPYSSWSSGDGGSTMEEELTK